MDSDTVVSDQLTLFDPNLTSGVGPEKEAKSSPSGQGPSQTPLHVSFGEVNELSDGLSTPLEVGII